ncbi:MAG TPA: glycosyltransferase family 39 protein [Rhizomicrobium sp.]|nr:glycosyltransferase family 39 protein [Rhizomicrobium sp.]
MVAITQTVTVGSAASWSSRLRVGVLLLAIVTLGFYIRYLFWFANGALADDYLSWAQSNYFGGITVGYVRMSLGILHGLFGTDQLAGAKAASPFLFTSEPIGYPPGYPIFLSGLWVLGFKSLQAMRLAQGFCDALAVIPLFYVLRWLQITKPIAIVGCLFYAVAPWWARGSIFPMAEALLPAAIIGVLALMAACARTRSLGAWFGLGIAASALSLVRPDMILLCGPLALWALMSARRDRRWSSAAACLVGFILLPMGWGSFNLIERGHFVITTEAGSYALWSGLGQVPNSYGYVVSDQLAADKLRQLGFGWHSKEMNDYYWHEYLDAWAQHPLHVLATVTKRFEMIAFDVDYPQNPTSGLTALVSWGLGPFLIAVAFLLWRRRYIEAFFISGPIGYALVSLGLVYIEPRYVRYAAISYLLADAVLLQAFVSAIARLKFSSWTVPAAAAAAVLVTLEPTVKGLIRIDQADAVQQLIENGPLPTFASLSHFEWQKSVPDAEVENTSDGHLSLTSSSGSVEYQIMAPVTLIGHVDYVALRVRADIKYGGFAAGILKQDGSRFLAMQPLAKEGDHDLFLVAPVDEKRVFLVITNYRPTNPGRSAVLIKSLDLLPLCDVRGGILGNIEATFLPPMQIEACPTPALSSHISEQTIVRHHSG